MQEVTRASRLALALALAAAPPAAFAVSFGNVETRSALGEPLDARIPFQLQEGDEVEASCFALVREPRDGPQMLSEGVLTIERQRGGGHLRIRTIAPVVEPAVVLRVRTSCAGQNGQVVREYPLLLDPRMEATPSSIASPAIAARLSAVEGETLEGIAAKVHPNNAEARRRYLASLRDLNPELAARGDREPIPAGTPIALADLRGPAPRPRVAPRGLPPPAAVETPLPSPTVAAAPATPAPSATAEAPASAPPPAPPARPRSERKATQRPKVAENESAPAPARAPRSAPARSNSGFSLKLSSREMDLTRSGQVDDRTRAQLRERLTILDADDQVAAMLQMRNSLKQLESRVADMQLKLDSLSSLPTRPQAAKSEPAKVEAPKIDPPTVEAKPEPAKVEPPKVDAPEVAKPADAPKADAEPAKVEPPVVAQPDAATAPKPAPRTVPPPDTALPSWLWSVVGVLLGLAVLIAIWLRRRNRDAHAAGEWADQPDEEEVAVDERVERHDDRTVTLAAHDDELNQSMDSAPRLAPPRTSPRAPASAAPSDHIEIAAEVRPEMDSDALLSTRLQDDSSGLRKRYLQERFPEVQNGTIVLEDPASVVKGARLFYEDGALTRAVELLQFAIEDNPGEVRPWLALFEIFRLERLTGQFAELADRFKLGFGKTEYWRKVQFFGREIDPGNALYKDEPLNSLETIGPREARKLAAGLSTVSTGSNVDPVAENWLNAPMDFQNEVLANELRMSLMAGASLTEQDLIPNPMPALRGVEVFNPA